MALLRIRSGPQHRLSGMSEISTAQVWRGVLFLPGDIVQDLVALLLKSHSDGVDIMQRTRYPDGARWLQDTLAFAYPRAVKLVLFLDRKAFIPISLIDRHLLATLAGYAIIAEEIGRIGEYHIDSAIRDEGQQFECIATH